MSLITPESFIFCIILAVPLFFFLKWLLNKTKLKQSIKAPVTIVATMLFAPVVYLTLIYVFFSFLSYEPQKKFSKKGWDEMPLERYMMIDDLVQKKLLIGKDSDFVKNTIGSSAGSYTDSLARTTWNYHLGMSSGGLGFLYHGMQVTFKHNKVVNVQHFRVQD